MLPDLLDVGSLGCQSCVRSTVETAKSTREVETNSDHTAIADVLLLRHSRNLKFGDAIWCHGVPKSNDYSLQLGTKSESFIQEARVWRGAAPADAFNIFRVFQHRPPKGDSADSLSSSLDHFWASRLGSCAPMPSSKAASTGSSVTRLPGCNVGIRRNRLECLPLWG
jgi:hypothetical protein